MKSEMLQKINNMIDSGMKTDDIADNILSLYPTWTFENAKYLVRVQRARLDKTYLVKENS